MARCSAKVRRDTTDFWRSTALRGNSAVSGRNDLSRGRRPFAYYWPVGRPAFGGASVALARSSLQAGALLTSEIAVGRVFERAE
jgi:hypothetical protein